MTATPPRYDLQNHPSAELGGDKPPRYRQVMRDLSLSFYVTQGGEKFQSKWQGAAAAYYPASWSEEDLEQLPQIIASVDATIAAMQEAPATQDAAEQPAVPTRRPPVPGAHQPTVQAFEKKKQISPAQQYAKYWAPFRDLIITAAANKGDTHFSLPTAEIASLATAVADRDVIFQSSPRTGGHIFDDDPHASLFRAHVLQGASTGSEAYDAVFGLIRSLLEASADADSPLRQDPAIAKMWRSITHLKHDWQRNHPSLKFEEDPSARDTISPATLAVLAGLAIGTHNIQPRSDYWSPDAE